MTSLGDFRKAKMEKRGADILLLDPVERTGDLSKKDIEMQREIFENFLKPMRDKLYLKHIKNGDL